MFGRKRSHLILYILLIFFGAIVGLGIFVYHWAKNISPQNIFQSTFVQEQVRKRVGPENEPLLAVLPQLLGFTSPHTYLILFLNNTELRPGGGFIGSYAVVHVANGHPTISKVEGSETLDKAAIPEKLLPPPAPLKQHLDVDHWYFRDSNWSPDFAASARQVLDSYERENGDSAHDIDTVVGITTDVLEELLRLNGPITVQGLTFTADNVTEQLEYEVEYGYAKRGISFADRKKIIGELFTTLLEKSAPHALTNTKSYFDLVQRLGQEKQIIFYSKDATTTATFGKLGWTGTVSSTPGDYLLWVDANLAALKTDHALERTLSYTITRDAALHYIATAEMTYTHNGTFDWRTSRYRTYTRIFVPVGAQLVNVDGAMKWDRTTAPGTIDEGDELGKHWFGTFIAIEPHTTKTLRFTYQLPDSVAEEINHNNYYLLIQKEIGTHATSLTLNLDFGKTITGATPAEDKSKWGDTRYEVKTDLSVDREFNVGL